MTDAATQLREKGFVVARGVLTPDEVDHYRAMLIERSGIDPATYTDTGRGGKSWNHTDGVSKDPDFWDLIFNAGLRDEVGQAIGPGFKYLQHSDLQVGFSAVAWHRDNVSRSYGVGPDWDESDGPYGLVRVGIYLQRFADSGFRLGFIPGSHRFSATGTALQRTLREFTFKLQGGLAYLGPTFQQLTRSAEWVATEPGDAIVFDPRILHSGSYIKGLKLSMFVGYGQENRHFADLQNYYRHVRKELGYEPFSAGLIERLRAEDLYAESIQDSEHVEGAYVPVAPLRKVMERRLKG
jgi:hypothetical protein